MLKRVGSLYLDFKYPKYSRVVVERFLVSPGVKEVVVTQVWLCSKTIG